MNWVFIAAGIVVLLLLFAAAYAFASDPQEVDAEEGGAIRKENEAARQRMLAKEEAVTEAEMEKEKEEYVSGN
jgi:hypothetical protein